MPSGQSISVSVKDCERINALEQKMAGMFPPAECPVTHAFTPGLYMREIFMPAGTLLTSKIHKTEHPYVILSGKVSVWIGEGEEVLLEGPYVGVTKPGTRRVLYIHEDTRWITFHPTEETDLTVIEQKLIEPHDFPKLAYSEQTRIGTMKDLPCRGLLSE